MFFGQTQPDITKGVTSSLGKNALQFNSANLAHVNHGTMWRPSVTYTSFYFEALVKPDGTGQYVVSGGYGGGHCLLFGVNAVSGGYCTLTGNVYFDGTPTSFATADGIPVNKWSHIAVCGDAVGTKITVLINGVPSAVVTGWSGTRRTAAESDSQCFIGGSDHQNYGGKIACVRLFDNISPANLLPYANPHYTVVRPAVENMGWSAVVNGSTVINASFLADYRTGTTKDWSLGLNGVKHDGFLVETISAGNAGLTTYDYLQNGNRDASKRPQWVVDEFKFTHSETPATPTVGATIFDSFGRADCHKGNASTLSLGTTEVGGKTWITPTTKYGILNGRAFSDGSGGGLCYVTDTASDGTIRLYKLGSGNIATGVGANVGIVCKLVDANNYNVVNIDEYGSGYVQQYVAGAYTGFIGSPINFGTTWNYIEVRLNGSEIKVYNGATLKATQTMTQNLAGTHKGFRMNTPLVKVDKFEVL